MTLAMPLGWHRSPLGMGKVPSSAGSQTLTSISAHAYLKAGAEWADISNVGHHSETDTKGDLHFGWDRRMKEVC
jgi:hypothetical protein